jgi:hypothetical protein
MTFAAGNISFWRKVSSEATYDLFKFFIDDIEKGSWSGNLGWEQFTYPVTAGAHTLKWQYSKDVNTSSGSDCAWVDDIVLPPTNAGVASMFYMPSQTIAFDTVNSGSSSNRTFTIQNLGNQTLSGTITAPLHYVIMPGNSYSVNYNVNACSSAEFTLSAVYGQTGDYNETINVTSNDPFMPSTEIHVTAHVGNDIPGTPIIQTKLQGNYPNPFNPVTYIAFSLKTSGKVKLDVFNLKGQLVKTLVNENMASGQHRVLWDGKDNDRHQVASGIYLYRFQSGAVSDTKKMMLMK